MWPRDSLSLHGGAVLIDLVGGLVIAGYAAAAVAVLVRTGRRRARLLVAEGAVLGLSFKTAGTLLKALQLHTWDQILMFATVLALRVALKRLFAWEKGRLGGGDSRPPPTRAAR